MGDFPFDSRHLDNVRREGSTMNGDDRHEPFRADRRDVLKGMLAAAVAGLGPAFWPEDAVAQAVQPLLDATLPVTPALAYATHNSRVLDLARVFATRDDRADLGQYAPGGKQGPNANEDALTALIAHCHVLTRDPAFGRPGAAPSAQAVPTTLVHLVRNSTLGTPTALHSNTSYDVVVRCLLVLYYRYPTVIGAAGKNHILLNLFPPDLVGGHPESIEVVEIANGTLGEGKSLWSKISGGLLAAAGGALAEGVIPGSGEVITPSATLAAALSSKLIRVPESENHLLMIESSRYLINQIRREGNPQDLRYDNQRNGLRDWLLKQLSTIAQHDFLEFNARPYSRYSLLALLNLHEFAADPLIRTAAQHVLDYIMMKFAVSSSRGRRVTPFRRQQYRINHANGARDDLLAANCDEVAAMFLSYTGTTDGTGHPVADFPFGLLYGAVLAGTAAYRPTPAAYIAALDPALPPAVHRFYHGVRPQLPASADIAEPGLELYASSPSFLVTAGGSFLNSGYGHDEFAIPGVLYSWEQTSRAQACTLIPRRLDPAFHDLLRFEPYPDPPADPMATASSPVADDQANMFHTSSVNTGVQIGLMAGANLRPAEKKTVFESSPLGGQALCFHNGEMYVAWLTLENARLGLGIGRVKTTTLMGLEGVEAVSDVLKVRVMDSIMDIKQLLGFTNNAPPAISAYGVKLVVAWTDPQSRHIQVAMYSPGSNALEFQTTLGDTSDYGPALVQHNGSLFLGWTGTGDHKLNVARFQFDLAAHRFGLDRKVTLADSSESGPSLASLRGRLFLAWRGTGENKLNISFSEDGGTTFAGKGTYEESSSHQPSLTAFGDYLYLAWKGRGNEQLNVAKVILLGNTSGKTSLGDLVDKTVLGEKSPSAPAICSGSNSLNLSWQGIDKGFLNLRLSADGKFQSWSGWRFFDHSDAGFYLAVYRTPPSAAQQKNGTTLDSLGIVYAAEKTDMDRLGIDFSKFEEQVRTKNAHLPAQLQYGGTYSFLPPDGRKFTIWFQLEGEKYRARVTETHQFIQDFSELALVSGPYMSAPGGHDGLLEIRHPGCEAAPVVLDYRDWRTPKRDDAKSKCPSPWLDRANALLDVSTKLRLMGRGAEADAARAESDALHKEMAALGQPGRPPTLPADTAATTLQKLGAMGVDYSVREADVRSWLGNPQYTPYPAIADVLLASGWKFKAPVYLDVIVGFYEKTAGVRSPRASSDVRLNVLQAAILAASNERRGTNVQVFNALLR